MRYLCLDLGGRRIGVAISDALGMIARPLEIFERRSRIQDFEHLRTLVTTHKVESIIVGLPLNMDGTEGPQAAWVRDYTSALAAAITVPVLLWDERLTTEEAKAILRAKGERHANDQLDALAAAIILQSYLNHLSDEVPITDRSD